MEKTNVFDSDEILRCGKEVFEIVKNLSNSQMFAALGIAKIIFEDYDRFTKMSQSKMMGHHSFSLPERQSSNPFSNSQWK